MHDGTCENFGSLLALVLYGTPLLCCLGAVQRVCGEEKSDEGLGGRWPPSSSTRVDNPIG